MMSWRHQNPTFRGTKITKISNKVFLDWYAKIYHIFRWDKKNEGQLIVGIVSVVGKSTINYCLIKSTVFNSY